VNKTNLLERFKYEAEAVDANVFITRDKGTLVKSISSFCKQKGITKLPVKLPEKGNWADINLHLSEEGIELITEPTRDIIEEYGVALSIADYGIAETGTVVFFETSADEVRSGTIPAIHLVLIKAEDILISATAISDEMDKFIGECIAKGRPSRVSFISGPSRTADIERTLTVGVHGPKELVIFILDENENTLTGGIS
jgi:L-lactate dehydrogenase complex protein LldG